MTAFTIAQVETGDVLLEEGRRPAHWAIRSLTGQQWSHVGLMFYLRGPGDGPLFVADMTGLHGYQVMTIGKWMEAREGSRVYWGIAPPMVREQQRRVLDYIVDYEGRNLKMYGYLELPKIWLAQMLRIRVRSYFKVCSTYVQGAWEAAGFRFPVTPDPGDIGWYCESVVPLRGMESAGGL